MNKDFSVCSLQDAMRSMVQAGYPPPYYLILPQVYVDVLWLDQFQKLREANILQDIKYRKGNQWGLETVGEGGYDCIFYNEC